MTAGPVPPGADDDPIEPDDPAPPLDKPLSRPGWDRREVEKVVPEEIVVDAGHRQVDVALILPWDMVGDVRLTPQIGKPGVTVLGPEDDPFLAPEPAQDFADRDAGTEAFLFDLPAAADESKLVLEAAAGRPESRSLHAEAPESVRPRQRFAISVQLRRAPSDPGGASSDLRPFLISASGRQVTIDLHVSGGLKVLSDSTCSLTVRPGQDSDPVRFELEAAQTGPAAVTLRAFALPADYLGQLRLALPVNDAVSGGHRTVGSPPFQVGTGPDRSATLEVDVDPFQRLMSFRLRGPGEIGVQRPVTVSLAEAVENIAAGLQRKLDQIAKGSGLSPQAVEALLRGTGADLWQRLLPASVKDLLMRNLHSLDALVIIGADDPIPWELLLPVTPGKAQAFLSDQVLVTRWAFDAASPKLVFGAGPVRYVLPDAAPPAALAEIVQLEALLGTGKRIGTLNALLDELAEAAFGLLHFAAHNIVASDLPASAWVKLDQPFQQGMLGADRLNAVDRAAPLVFMNACNSGAGSPLWVGSTGWAGRFLAAGAGAFVGSLWQVRDGPAKDFAASFYGELSAGKALGAAFQAARKSVGKDGDPTRLGYTLFGNTAARLAQQAGAPP